MFVAVAKCRPRSLIPSELIGQPMGNGQPRHVDSVWPYRNLLDMTPGGRVEGSTPIQDHRHVCFTEHFFREPE